MIDWYVGMKVVCVGPLKNGSKSPLIIDNIYTITWIGIYKFSNTPTEVPAIKLREVKAMNEESPFGASLFRPLVSEKALDAFKINLPIKELA